MSEANQPPLHTLCGACGKMACEHLTAELQELRASLQRACCSGCGLVLESREAALAHVLGCEKHPAGVEVATLRRERDLAVESLGDCVQERDDARRRLADLRAASFASLEAGDAHVSEEEAFRRLTNLARLVGYAPGAPPRPTEFPPKDLDELARWASGLARWISGQVEVKGSGWAFALFLYREPGEGERAGQVVQVSRDREKTKEAVARWLMDLLSPPEKGAAT